MGILETANLKKHYGTNAEVKAIDGVDFTVESGEFCVGGRQFGQTIVLITHNPEVAQMADRTVHIEDGRIVGGAAK